MSTPMLHRRWAILGGAIALVLMAVTVALVRNGFRASRVPAGPRPAEAPPPGAPASADLAYRSPRGFEILIPAGFGHTVPQTGDVVLAITRSDGAAAFVVATKDDGKNLDTLVGRIRRRILHRNRSYRFGSAGSVRPAGGTSVAFSYEATENGSPLRGRLVLVRGKSGLFQIVFSCPANGYPAVESIFDRILASFRAS